VSGPALGGGAPWTGGPVTAHATCVLAPNPGPMTLDGTNTWVLSWPGAGSVVVDPGPDHDDHLAAVVARALTLDAPVRHVLLTHAHLDHSEGAAAFSARVGGVPVRALDPAVRLGDEGLGHGDVVVVGDLRLRVLSTPGHTSDSLSFVLEEPGGTSLLTGDTVLGRGTTVVAHPDGRLGPYLDSLRRLADEVDRVQQLEGTAVRVLPGHGPVLDDAGAALAGYLEHRRQRLEQVRAALVAGDGTARQVVERVYADVDPVLWPAAELSVRAQLEHLRAQEPDLPG
jgi:glyoxylase-like metal-dependent hydrolase (beta-lactamase superfamily II)